MPYSPLPFKALDYLILITLPVCDLLGYFKPKENSLNPIHCRVILWDAVEKEVGIPPHEEKRLQPAHPHPCAGQALHQAS